MHQKIKSKFVLCLKYIFKLFGLSITSYATFIDIRESLIEYEKDTSRKDLEFVRAFKPSNYEQIIPLLEMSKSELRQDIFVLSESGYKKNGYFVEFGATDGINGSNTHLLETKFLWSGILVEPAKVWREELFKNRPDADIETLCVWKDSESSLIFNETDVASLSTIDTFSSKDIHENTRRAGKKYQVKTISLNDLLRKFHAPKYIDYLSIDTEGSEYEILKAFDFNEYSIRIITVEHNYNSHRELIFSLLTNNGYKRTHESISNFDDWYIRE
jgi:FkbM family methyltransferase